MRVDRGDSLGARRFSSIQAAPPQSWDRLVATGAFYLSSEWLLQFEGPERTYPAAEPTYVVVTRGDQLLAAAACYLVRRTGRIPPHIQVHDACFGGAASPITEEELDPYLVCGAPVGENRLLVDENLDHAERALVLTRLVAEVRSMGQELGARLVAFGLLPAPEAAELVAVDPELVPVFGASDCTLPLPGNFDAYLGSLRHHRRSRVKADVRHFQEAGLRFERKRFSEVTDEAAALMVASERKWGIQLELEWLRAAFRRLASFIDQRARVFCVLQGDELVSWSLCLHHHGMYYSRLSGTDDAAVPRRAAVYFNNLFYEPMRWAESDGVRAIHFGSGSLSAKVEHGCHVLPLFYLLFFPSGGDASTDWLRHLRERSLSLIRRDQDELERGGLPRDRAESVLQIGSVGELLRAGRLSSLP